MTEKIFCVTYYKGKNDILKESELAALGLRVPGSIVETTLAIIDDNNIQKVYTPDKDDESIIYVTSKGNPDNLICVLVQHEGVPNELAYTIKSNDLIAIDEESKDNLNSVNELVEGIKSEINGGASVEVQEANVATSPCRLTFDNDIHAKTIVIPGPTPEWAVPIPEKDSYSFFEVFPMMTEGVKAVSRSGLTLIIGKPLGKHRVDMLPGTILEDEVFFEDQITRPIKTYNFEDISLKALVLKNPEAKFTISINILAADYYVWATELESLKKPNTLKDILFMIYSKCINGEALFTHVMNIVELTEFKDDEKGLDGVADINSKFSISGLGGICGIGRNYYNGKPPITAGL